MKTFLLNSVKTFFKIKKYKNEQANMRMSQLHSQCSTYQIKGDQQRSIKVVI